MVNRPVNRCILQDLAEIWPGYPFRGKLPHSDRGEAFVVQFRHIVVGDFLRVSTGSTLDRADLTGQKRPNFLREGDVLFMAKGARNYAIAVKEIPENTVCTPNFYHLRIKSEGGLTPEFLAWQLNHRDAQRYFAACSQGSVSPSITKSQLGELPLVVPPLDRQNLLVGLASAAFREEQVLGQLIDNRRRMVSAVGHDILHPGQR